MSVKPIIIGTTNHKLAANSVVHSSTVGKGVRDNSEGRGISAQAHSNLLP